MSNRAFILLLAAIMVYTLWSLHFRSFVADDAYISFRYARNLWNQGKIVWNDRGPATEGYTNFLWVVLLSPTTINAQWPLLTAKVISFLCGLLILWLVWLISRRLVPAANSTWRAIAVLIVAMDPLMGLHTNSGMETMAFSLVVLSLVFLILEIINNNHSSIIVYLFSLLWFISALLRPEGVLVGMLFIIASFHQLRLSQIIKLTSIMMLASVIYMTWRIITFDHFFPNSFYIKMGGDFSFTGLTYVIKFIIWEFMPVLLVFILFRQQLQQLSSEKYVIALPIVFSFIFYSMSRPLMGFGFRFLFPFGLLAAPYISLSGLAHNSFRRKVLITLIIIGVLMGSYRVLPFPSRYSTGLNQLHIPLGKALATIGRNAHRPLIACGDAGAIPYFSHWEHLDTIGLNNNFIAINGFDINYILAKQPDLFLLYSDDGKVVSKRRTNGYEVRIASHPKFLEAYRKIGTGKIWSGFYLLYYIRNDSPFSQEILNAL